MKRLAILIAVVLAVGQANAGPADVIAAQAAKSGSGWRFDVTVRHGDAGWEHYADAWRVMTPDGTVLGTRTLYHPHVDEQPFTRSLTGVTIPAGVTSVVIEAHDNVHGWGGQTIRLDLKR